jgi:LysM repeat protein
MKLRFGMILLIMALMGTLGIPVVGAQNSAGCINVITVWDGDTLYGIARRENFVVSELAAVNNIPVTTRLRVGDRLCVDGLAIAAQPPLTGGGSPNNQTPPPTNTNPNLNFRRGQGPLPAGWTTINVLFGNTLYSISRALNGVTVQQLAQSNNIVNVNQLFAGETLLVPPANTNTGGSTNVPVHRPAPGTIPTIAIPRLAQSGDSIGVNGANYPGNTPVDIYFEQPTLGLITSVVTTVTTNADGTFSSLVTVPNAFSNGAPINNLPAVSVSGYTRTGGYWAMNYFIVAR